MYFVCERCAILGSFNKVILWKTYFMLFRPDFSGLGTPSFSWLNTFFFFFFLINPNVKQSPHVNHFYHHEATHAKVSKKQCVLDKGSM